MTIAPGQAERGSTAGTENVELMLLGGTVVRESRMLDGFMAEDNLRQVHADRLFRVALPEDLMPAGPARA
ncbi:hypothetical protein ACFV23_20440 [Streptomyces sp. NPDC059627]